MHPHVDCSNLLVIVSLKDSDGKLIDLRVTLNLLFCFSWLCCYMAQMNPLIGPRLTRNVILLMAREWGNPLSDLDTFVPDTNSTGGH